MRFIHSQDTITAMIDAVEESIVDSFTLYCSDFPNLAIAGQIKGCNKELIFVVIDQKQCSYLQSKPNQLYNIHFNLSQANRVAFQQQHSALYWMQEHDLFDVLINNPRYDFVPANTDPVETEGKCYEFW